MEVSEYGLKQSLTAMAQYSTVGIPPQGCSSFTQA